METTRHFTSTVYVVNNVRKSQSDFRSPSELPCSSADGATALHHHERIDRWLPPGGHIDRDELPLEAAKREVLEEIGQQVTIPGDERTEIGPGSYELPKPAHLNLHDIHHYDDGTPGHQHIDFLYYGTVPSRDITPQDGERRGAHWEWFTVDDLERDDRLSPEVRDMGTEAIQTFE